MNQGREDEGLLVSDKHSSTYIDEMLRATFCGVFPGNGWGHIETPILCAARWSHPRTRIKRGKSHDAARNDHRYGCIPVVVQDAILTPWERELNFSAFGVRIPRAQLPQLPVILRMIPPTRVAAMQAALNTVWERFTFSSIAIAERDRQCAVDQTSANCRDLRRKLTGAAGTVSGHDAVDTLLHVLHARLLTRQRWRRNP